MQFLQCKELQQSGTYLDGLKLMVGQNLVKVFINWSHQQAFKKKSFKFVFLSTVQKLAEANLAVKVSVHGVKYLVGCFLRSVYLLWLL